MEDLISKFCSLLGVDTWSEPSDGDDKPVEVFYRFIPFAPLLLVTLICYCFFWTFSFIISIRSWFNKKTHRLLRWVLFAKSSGERVLLLTGTEDSGLQIIREKDWRCKEADGTKRLKVSDLRKFPSQGSRLEVLTIFISDHQGSRSSTALYIQARYPARSLDSHTGEHFTFIDCHNLQLLIQHHPPDSPCHQR